MLAVALVATSAFAPSTTPAGLRSRAAAAPVMADRKVYAFDDTTVFEARETSVTRKPVYLLSAIEGTGVASYTAEAGLLSGAEQAGVFSTLEGLGAFSLIESTLPLVEKLGLLSKFEALLDVEAGLLFSLANFLIALGPIIFVLQICDLFPAASGAGVPLEVAFDVVTLGAGAVLFGTAFAISKLQLAADEIE